MRPLQARAIRPWCIDRTQYRSRSLHPGDPAGDVSLVEAIPDSAMRWAPTEGMRDFAQQVAHAANNLFIARAVFGQSGPDLLSESDDSLLSDKGAMMDEVVAAIDHASYHR